MLRRHSSLWAPRFGFGLQALGPLCLRRPCVDCCLVLTSVTMPVAPAAGPQTGPPQMLTPLLFVPAIPSAATPAHATSDLDAYNSL